MQRFAAKAGIGAVVLAIAAVAFLAGSAIENGNAAVIQGQQVTRGIEWVNFSTGVDYNAHSGNIRGEKTEYFAEIHLLIPLGTGPSIANQADRYARDGDTTRLRQLLIDHLEGAAINVANIRLINNLLLRP